MGRRTKIPIRFLSAKDIERHYTNAQVDAFYKQNIKAWEQRVYRAVKKMPYNTRVEEISGVVMPTWQEFRKLPWAIKTSQASKLGRLMAGKTTLTDIKHTMEQTRQTLAERLKKLHVEIEAKDISDDDLYRFGKAWEWYRKNSYMSYISSDDIADVIWHIISDWESKSDKMWDDELFEKLFSPNAKTLRDEATKATIRMR